MPENQLVSILIPTYNEAQNIADVLNRTAKILEDERRMFEILVIDDASLDHTAEIAELVLEKRGRVIRRVAEARSLSLSVLDGIKEAKGDVVIVMDGDGSHPPEVIPEFIRAFQDGYDLVVASRYVATGSSKKFPVSRKIISSFACFLGRLVTPVKDNTSGYFSIKKTCLENTSLTPAGFKIGLEIFVKGKHRSFKEIPYIFVNRTKGKSKLKLRTILEYLAQLASLWAYKNFKK